MTEQPDSIIRLEGIHKSFNAHTVLEDLDLNIVRGQTTVVIGPSGCGKTVLLKHIVALLRPDRGKVFFDGMNITNLSERQLVPIRRRIGFLFQSNALFDSMTVAENIHFPLIEHGIRSEAELQQRCRRVLRLVGLDGMQQRMPEELSGGQKKRVALARAIALNPEVILYDEPTTGLDPIRADLINELILKLQNELRTTTLVVTHDMDSARKVADRIVMLYNSQILVDTTPEGLREITDDVVVRFVDGQATPEELDELRHGHAGDQSDHDREKT
ncbi:MAG: ABC transporter ATP-binding protein [Phycisphaerae bacterium]|nr:ABC transporter ATP-binding protein [Phycisphaerae bacterium]